VRAEIVCTSLHNLAWPLICYRVGDLCLVDPDARCECGMPGRIIERIEGRTGEGFRLPDGTRITNISVIAKRCRHVRFLQVIQEEVGRIQARVVPDDGHRRDRDGAALVREFRSRLGETLAVDVVYAREPAPRGRRGRPSWRPPGAGPRPARQIGRGGGRTAPR
jgi:phenylacetate-coenzyme A ligase PaaK-like adenylate-forming protein